MDHRHFELVANFFQLLIQECASTSQFENHIGFIANYVVNNNKWVHVTQMSHVNLSSQRLLKCFLEYVEGVFNNKPTTFMLLIVQQLHNHMWSFLLIWCHNPRDQRIPFVPRRNNIWAFNVVKKTMVLCTYVQC